MGLQPERSPAGHMFGAGAGPLGRPTQTPPADEDPWPLDDPGDDWGYAEDDEWPSHFGAARLGIP